MVAVVAGAVIVTTTAKKVHSRVDQIMIGFYWYIKMLKQQSTSNTMKTRNIVEKFFLFVRLLFSANPFVYWVWNECREARAMQQCTHQSQFNKWYEHTIDHYNI